MAAGAMWPYIVGTETLRSRLEPAQEILNSFGWHLFLFYIKLKKYENSLSVWSVSFSSELSTAT